MITLALNAFETLMGQYSTQLQPRAKTVRHETDERVQRESAAILSDMPEAVGAADGTMGSGGGG